MYDDFQVFENKNYPIYGTLPIGCNYLHFMFVPCYPSSQNTINYILLSL